ncbi:class I SAM-dependent methyltransferase [Bdellovibrio sp. HCB2-146]|uniref:class I SAM-dependent methyltransferase n=1 Tax=Bdellovibrio sp. HCB2-146 TaxID=3394362 RepID=UPI0039BD1320
MSKSNVLKQELFVISEQTQKHGVHQDQVTPAPESTFLRFQDLQYEVISLSCFDCTIRMPASSEKEFKAMMLASPGLEADLISYKIVAQRLNLHWIRPAKGASPETEEITMRFEVVSDAINLERLFGLKVASQVLTEQNEYGISLLQLPPEYKALVFEFRDLLANLKIKIDKLEGELPKDNFQDTQEYRKSIAQSIAQYLEDLRIPRRYADAAKYLQGLSPEQQRLAMEFARAQVGPLVYGAPFANRAYFKPRGYAGDYEMMNHLYRNELVGKTLFDQCMHKYFVEESAGAAVKNRGYYLFDKISDLFARTPSEQPLKILSVASGPAMEQQIFLKQRTEHYNRPVQFTCLDSDEGSLKHAQRQLLTLEKQLNSGFDFQFNNMAIRNVIARGLPEQGYDLIYSAGLFDYFTDQVARAAAAKMITSVKSGGRLIIGNFSKDTLSASFMELVLDWHLIYRSEADLLRIFQGLGSKIWVEQEPLGINLFVVIEK